MIEIYPMEQGEEREAYELVVRTFHVHVAPVYSKKGVAKFLGMLSPDGLSDMRTGEDSFILVAGDRQSILGVVSVINENHIALLFVDPDHQQTGIGKNLIERAITECSNRNPALSAITVSSSPNSKAFYEGVGFEAQGGGRRGRYALHSNEKKVCQVNRMLRPRLFHAVCFNVSAE